EEVFFKVVAPAQSRIVLAEHPPDRPPATPPVKTLLVQKIADSPVPSSVVSAPLRRISRPRGPINRRYLRVRSTGAGSMFKLFNVPPWTPTDPTEGKKGPVTIDKVSDSVLNVTSSGTFVWNPDPVGHWERPSTSLLQMLSLFRLKSLSVSVIGSRPTTFPELLEATKAHQAYLENAFKSLTNIPAPERMDLPMTKEALLQSVNPEKTINMRVKASLILAGAGQTG